MLSSRQKFPAKAVQSHAGSAVSAFGGGKVAGNAAGKMNARTGSSDSIHTRAPRLVGGQLLLETSKFLAARGVDPRSERWRKIMRVCGTLPGEGFG